MVGGCNSNVSLNGRTYHVQTEDKGVESGRFETLVYLDGAILASDSQSYDGIPGGMTGRDHLRRIMVEHHRAMVRKVETGEFLSFSQG
jgi:hypothetical protein